MALILCIETATAVCSVALINESKILAIKETDEKNAHSSVLNVFVEDIFKQSGISFTALDAVAVSMGPGSYTGLRIGISAAKGYCFALDKPLIAIPTLQSMANGFIMSNPTLPDHALLCPMIDARRMEVFTAFYHKDLSEFDPVSAKIIENDSFSTVLAEYPVYFFGDGAYKCKELQLNNPNAFLADSFAHSAAHMAPLASIRFRQLQFENIAYFEPFYLKDFIAGRPKVKGLYD